MRATHISITNLRAFDSFTVDLPSVCILSGQHGSGKSSIEEILKYSLGRRPLADKGTRGVEHDPTMLRMGAEKGEAVITFSEDSGVEHLRLVVTPDSTTRQIKTRGSKKWVAASAEIDAFAEAISYDPMVLKELSARERVAALLKVMPLEITSDEIHAAVVGTDMERLAWPQPSLDSISAAYQTLEISRRDLNRDVKSLTAHADELESALPPETQAGSDWSSIAAGTDAHIAALRKTEADTIQRLTKEVSDFKETAANIKVQGHLEIDEDINALISDLERKRAERKQVLSGKEADAVEGIRSKANAELAQVRAELTPEIERLTAEASAARTHAEEQQRTQGARQAAQKARATATEKEAKSNDLTASMERLAKLKQEVAGRMKIPGMTIESPGPGMEVDACRIEDGKLVPFSCWNDSDKDVACLKVAVLARGSYGLVCVDDISKYLPDRKKAIIDAAKRYSMESGMQFVFAEAVAGPLTVVDGAAV
jgi:hypothetical protein